MIRNLRNFGVAVIALLAMSALLGSSALGNATTKKFTSMVNTYPILVHGTSAAGTETFTTEAGTLECAGTESGTLTEASQTLRVHPTYSSCKAFGFLGATVTTTGCDYVSRITTEVPGTSPRIYQAHVDLKCEAGKAITLVAGTCEVTIGEQTGLTTKDYVNDPTTTAVHVVKTLGGIVYVVVKDGFGCPFNGTGAKIGATYTSHEPLVLTTANGVHIG
jgi:hypothetical protein